MAALMVSAVGASAAKDPPLIEPTGPWVMNYADDSCHLSRTFGAGDDAVTVEFRKFFPSESFELLIAGRTLKSNHIGTLVTEFGPDGEAHPHRNALEGKLTDGRVVLETSDRLMSDDKDKNESGKKGKTWKADEDLAPIKVDHEAEAKITQLRLSGPIPRSLLLRLGPMDKPMDAMRACLDELLTHWGIDAAAHRSLTRRAAPTSNPGNWLTSSDYPTEMLRKNRSGVVHFRLMIDAQGKPTACVIQTGGSDFDKLTCSLLMKRARLSPALDANGHAIPSYYSNNVVWLT